jgi:dihydrofolate synthase/folylpolyglutamate synthase
MPASARPLTDYASVAEHLVGLKSIGVRFGIDRMTRWAELLGHPERGYPVIHLAGTNGKGSVAAMLESILRLGGCRTGLYTSPHLVRLGERVQVDRVLLTEREIVDFTAELAPLAQKLAERGPDEHPTFFEFMTAMAFLKFYRAKVDVAIVETGLGGRLDATNIVQPEVVVITSIGLDHMEFLGNSLAEIAREKAGIIKAGRPVVLGRLPGPAEQVIREVAREKSAPLHSVREIFGEDSSAYPATNLEGEYQRWNAATATVTARLLADRFKLDDAIMVRGLRQVTWSGRWQRTMIGGRTLILDASHNPEGAQVLDANLRELVAATGRKPVVVTGVLGESRAKALLEVICRQAREVHLIPPQTGRACTYDQLEAAVPAESRTLLRRATLDEVFPNSQTCTVGGPDDVIVVTGSIYLLGEVLARIEPARGGGEPRLQDF